METPGCGEHNRMEAVEPEMISGCFFIENTGIQNEQVINSLRQSTSNSANNYTIFKENQHTTYAAKFIQFF
jgi:predicted ATPase with chaperone activity